MEKSIGKGKTKFLKQVQINFRYNLLLGPRAPQLKFTVGPEDEPAPRKYPLDSSLLRAVLIIN